MNKNGNSEKIRQSYDLLLQYLPLKLPGMGWYFSDYCPSNAIVPDGGGWPCMFEEITKVSLGHTLCLSKKYPGCASSACYLGNAFFQAIEAPVPRSNHIVLDSLSDIDDEIDIEVVVLWVDAQSLAALVTLANYDKPSNDNVILPFASGCQSICTIPYREKFKKNSKAVVGVMEPAARRYMSPEILSFSIWANRFKEITDHISGSSLENKNWIKLIQSSLF